MAEMAYSKKKERAIHTLLGDDKSPKNTGGSPCQSKHTKENFALPFSTISQMGSRQNGGGENRRSMLCLKPTRKGRIC